MHRNGNHKEKVPHIRQSIISGGNVFSRRKRWLHGLFVPYSVPLPFSSRGNKTYSIHSQIQQIQGQGRRTLKIPILRCFAPPLVGVQPVYLPVFLTIVTLFGLCIFPILLLHKHPFSPFTPVSTLLTLPREREVVWRWEVASGRVPNWRGSGSLAVDGWDGIQYQRNSYQHSRQQVLNPALPVHGVDRGLYKSVNQKSKYRPTSRKEYSVDFIPTGWDRQYIGSTIGLSSISHTSPNTSVFPHRPHSSTTIDMDKIMQYCDFQTNQYVRDCLEVLRRSAGLGASYSLEIAESDTVEYVLVDGVSSQTGRDLIYPGSMDEREQYEPNKDSDRIPRLDDFQPEYFGLGNAQLEEKLSAQRTKALGRGWVRTINGTTNQDTCDHDNPRIFHIYWTGDFTDKPYSAALSFLYTQNLNLHLPIPLRGANTAQIDWLAYNSVELGPCTPQLWFWINPGPAASLESEHSRENALPATELEKLARNPWSAPFLHRRFWHSIRFKKWDTAEMLDAIEELNEDRYKNWREVSLFNSGGMDYSSKKKQDTGDTKTAKDGDLFNRVGSSSWETYDRLSVILSDLARFVLTHRYGGIYLDADTIILRDWTPLFNYPGAFGYRWSRLRKYNTAVLKMSRKSATGSFIFKTILRRALGIDQYGKRRGRPGIVSSFLRGIGLPGIGKGDGEGGFDFHPMTITRYLSDAGLGGLLLMSPDALFDAAWLNTEGYQMDRPASPFLKKFLYFFKVPKETDSSASAMAIGFDGFFRGSFSYHFHNFWWFPFDPFQNYPNLGDRFETHALQGLRRKGSVHIGHVNDLSWSAVLKRTFEAWVRGERSNTYGEAINWQYAK